VVFVTYTVCPTRKRFYHLNAYTTYFLLHLHFAKSAKFTEHRDVYLNKINMH